jgi:2'-5' RNA ligase
MATGVSLWFDAALEAHVRALWREIAQRGISRVLHDGSYRPHVTLGVWGRLDVPRFVPLLRALAGTVRPLEIELSSFGAFPGDEGVAYLAPRVDTALIEFHRGVHALARSCGGDPVPWNSPDGWVPHCTVAWHATPAGVEETCRLALGAGLPWRGSAPFVGVIDTPAEVELHRIPLGPSRVDDRS